MESDDWCRFSRTNAFASINGLLLFDLPHARCTAVHLMYYFISWLAIVWTFRQRGISMHSTGLPARIRRRTPPAPPTPLGTVSLPRRHDLVEPSCPRRGSQDFHRPWFNTSGSGHTCMFRCGQGEHGAKEGCTIRPAGCGHCGDRRGGCSAFEPLRIIGTHHGAIQDDTDFNLGSVPGDETHATRHICRAGCCGHDGL